MKRRSFLKLIAGAACAVTAGISIALPELAKAQSVVPLLPKAPIGWKINPAWVNATHEFEFAIWNPTLFRRLEPSYHGMDFSKEALAPRFKFEDGKWVSIDRDLPVFSDEEIEQFDREDYLEFCRENGKTPV